MSEPTPEQVRAGAEALARCEAWKATAGVTVRPWAHDANRLALARAVLEAALGVPDE